MFESAGIVWNVINPIFVSQFLSNENALRKITRYIKINAIKYKMTLQMHVFINNIIYQN